MDLTKLVQQDKEREVNVKAALELSTTKYKLEKELESLRLRFITKEKEVKLMEKEVVSLKIEVPILEKQEEVVKEMLRALIEQQVVTNALIKTQQEEVWQKIDSFVSDARSMMYSQEKKEDLHQPRECLEKVEWQDRSRILELESEIEAMERYAKYQSARITELKLLRDLVEREADYE